MKKRNNIVKSGATTFPNNIAAKDSMRIAARQGHGFAAERVNNLWDKLNGKEATIIGDCNLKNGADRIVNGMPIQCKYWQTAKKSINACFEGGKFKYVNEDGSYQQIEVASDQYEKAVKAMERRISTRKIPGISDINDAKKLVREGKLNYEQAINIAKAGKIEGILFDAQQSFVVSGYVFGISALATFAFSVWDGSSVEKALERSIYTGLEIGGISLLTQIMTRQLTRMHLHNELELLLKPGIEKLAGANYDKIAKNAAKNGTAALATFIVFSVFEVIKFIRTRISGSQFFKNIVILSVGVACSIAGGAAGGIVGAEIGSIFGLPGAVVGTILVSILGGAIGSSITKSIMDHFVEDDAVKMLKIFEKALEDLHIKFVLTHEELDNIIECVKEEGDLPDLLTYMYYIEEVHEAAFSVAYCILEKIAEKEINKRCKITIPSKKEIFYTQNKIIKEALNYV